MNDTRRRNKEWTVCEENASRVSFDGAQLAVLMDIREELQRLNRLFRCNNFLNIPAKLDRIGRNTAKPKRKRAKRTP